MAFWSIGDVHTASWQASALSSSGDYRSALCPQPRVGTRAPARDDVAQSGAASSGAQGSGADGEHEGDGQSKTRWRGANLLEVQDPLAQWWSQGQGSQGAGTRSLASGGGLADFRHVELLEGTN
jgi:hypothetical protein